MDFNQTLNSRLKPILAKYFFKPTEERKDFIVFESDENRIAVSYNNYDNAGLLEIGNSINDSNAITNKLISAVFDADINLEEVTKEKFLENVVLLFEKFGKLIFNNDITLNKIRNFSFDEARKYTDKIIIEQNLKEADKAWEEKNYQLFLQVMEKIDIAFIPKSYHLKTEIAKKYL